MLPNKTDFEKDFDMVGCKIKMNELSLVKQADPAHPSKFAPHVKRVFHRQR